MAITIAKAKVKVVQARAAHSQKETELKVEQGCIQANLDALNAEKVKDATIAEAYTLLASLQDMGFKANSPVLQSIKDQRIASYVSEQTILSSEGLSAERGSDNASLTCYPSHPQPTNVITSMPLLLNAVEELDLLTKHLGKESTGQVRRIKIVNIREGGDIQLLG